MPYYQVTVTASVLMLVRADDEDDAAQVAYEEVNFYSAGVKDISEPKLLSADDFDRMRRHADQILN